MALIEAEASDYQVLAVHGNEQDQDDALAERLRGFVGKHEAEVNRRIGLKRPWEQERLQDLRQYHGKYESDILSELAKREGSELYLNVTRSKTNTAAAKLSDMLFPTDDRNWGIEPTPVPDLVRRLEEVDAMGQQVEDQANMLLESGQQEEAEAMIAQAQPVLDEAARARAVIQKADRAAEGMQEEIHDQLVECEYNHQARRVIEDACKLGTGIIKGPVKQMKPAMKWQEVLGPGGIPFTVMEPQEDMMRGAAYYVDPWHFFPDPDIPDIKDGDGTYERHLYKERHLRKLAQLPGFDRKAIRRLIKRGPRESSPYFVNDLRTITGNHQDGSSDTFHVFEYYGVLTAEDMMEIARAIGRQDMASDYEDVDPLAEVHVCVWFCDGEVIKFGEQALDSGECIYSTFCWQRDDGSVWGYGVPYQMRDIQAAICAFWRAILDNAGLSTVPQVVIDKTGIEPEDGSWNIEAGKIWLKTRVTTQGERLFEVHGLPSNLGDLMAMVNAAMQFVDDETGISMLAEGQQNSQVTKTAQGMSILMNSTNVVFRRVVKDFDDYLTTPLIRRFYDWTMQWSQDQSIKGDMKVVARGSSVLLVQEIQAQNMIGLFQLALSDPEIRAMTRLPEAYRRVVAAGKVPADDWVLTDDEIEEWRRAQAQQPQQPDPDMLKLEVQREIAVMDRQTKIELANIERDTKMMQLAETLNMKEEELRALLSREAMKIGHQERSLAAEMAMAEATGKSSGGAV